jgi:hypothetical protein
MCLTQCNHSLNALRRLSVEKMATLHWFLRERLNRLGLSTPKTLRAPTHENGAAQANDATLITSMRIVPYSVSGLVSREYPDNS